MAKRGRKPVVITRKIKLEELKAEMRRAQREKMLRYMERLRALQWFAQGRTRTEVEELLQRSDVTIRKWITLWNQGGFQALHPQFEHGRPPKLSAPHIEELKADLRRPPEAFGYPRGAWDVKWIRHHLREKWGITYNLTAVYRALRSWGITPKVPYALSANQSPAEVGLYWTTTVPELLREKKSGRRKGSKLG